jgi:hypothetical protein
MNTTLYTTAADTGKVSGVMGLLASLTNNRSGVEVDGFSRFLQSRKDSITQELPRRSADGTLSKIFPSPVVRQSNDRGSVILQIKRTVADIRALVQRVSAPNTNSASTAAGKDNKVSAPADRDDVDVNGDVLPVAVQVVDSTDDDTLTTATNPRDDNGLSTDLLNQIALLLQLVEKQLQAMRDRAGDSTALANNAGTSDVSLSLHLDTDFSAQRYNVDNLSPIDTGDTQPNSQLSKEFLALLEALRQKLGGANADITNIHAANTDILSVSKTKSDNTQDADLPRAFEMDKISEDLSSLAAMLQKKLIDKKTSDETQTLHAFDPLPPVRNTETVPAEPIVLTDAQNAADTKPSVVVATKNVPEIQSSNVHDGDNVRSESEANASVVAANGRELNSKPDANNFFTFTDTGKNSQDNTFGKTVAQVLPHVDALPDGLTASTPYNFASQLSSMRAANGGATGLPSPVDQVILQLHRGVKGGDDQMTIQLHPADLGKISVKLDIAKDGSVRGTFVADNPATLSSLLKDVRGLERALQDAGLRADPGSLQFSLGGQSGNNMSQTAQQSSQNNAAANVALDALDATLSVSGDAAEMWFLTPTRVNFKV